MHPESAPRVARSIVLAAWIAFSVAACSDVDRTRWSARFGSAESQHVMGSRHETGRGVEKDLEAAIGWYEEAAEQDHVPSQNRLVEIYEERGGPGDDERVEQWLRKLAETGDPDGQYRYGRRLADRGEALAGSGWIEQAAEEGHPASQAVVARTLLAKGERSNAVVLFQKAARAGDPDAAFELAKLAQDGVVSMSADEIEELVQQAAENGHAGAQFLFGDRLAEAEPKEERDYAAAARWYRLAAEQGFAPAQEAMGILYESGMGVTEDPIEAARWYRLAAEQGRATSENQLGMLHAKGRLPDEETAQQIAYFSAAKGDNQKDLAEFAAVARKNNDRRAVEWYRRAIDRGYTASMVNLAKLIEEGRVPDADPEEAIALYRQAAEAGDPNAKSLLASRYATGVGVQQDAAASLAMLESAAESGHGPSQISLGSLYLQGPGGGQPDPEKAAYWLGRAVDSGVEEAETSYAAMLAAGMGVPRNDDRARALFEKAAERDDPDGEYSLGVFYEEGRGGLPADAGKAAELWKSAARNGHSGAQAKLGIALVRGEGVAPNLVEAYAWLAASGIEQAKPWVEAIEKEMPAAMLRRAKRLAEERTEQRLAAEAERGTTLRVR